MEPIKTFSSQIVALPLENIDTDQIIPAKYLKVTDKTGLAEGLFQSWRYNPDGSGMEVVARGVRNSVGFDWHPQTRELWFSDHGRDWMGDNTPNDELNRMTRVGLNFGFPYCHENGVVDPDVKKANPCEGVTRPSALMGPHAAVMGVQFYTGNMFPKEYKNTMFIAQHGSWNRDPPSGYKVIFVPFRHGRPQGEPEDVLTGFLRDDGAALGRPVGVALDRQGALLVADDVGNTIWRVSRAGLSARSAP